MLDFLERALRHSFDVVRFSDPVAALAQARAMRFDVLITDQRMPQLSGLELIEEIAQLSPETVRVLISGFDDQPELGRALARASLHNFVLKPIDADTLMDAIATATETSRR
jgi:YesN/AraC family two-component response regulator